MAVSLIPALSGLLWAPRGAVLGRPAGGSVVARVCYGPGTRELWALLGWGHLLSRPPAPRPFGCCALVPGRPPSGTSRLLPSAWRMNSSTQPRWVRTLQGGGGLKGKGVRIELSVSSFRAPPTPTPSRRRMSWSAWPSLTADHQLQLQ